MKLRLIGLMAALMISMGSMMPVSASSTAPPQKPPVSQYEDCKLDGSTYPHGSIEKIDGKYKECMDGKWITPTRTDVPS